MSFEEPHGETSGTEGDVLEDDSQAECHGEGDCEGEASAEEIQTKFFNYNANEINSSLFEELHVTKVVTEEVQRSWADFNQAVGSREAVSEAVFSTLYESMRSAQELFKSPRAMSALRFLNGLQTAIRLLEDPPALKNFAEVLGVQHLDIEVTEARVELFRDAFLDMLLAELGDDITLNAQIGWRVLLNYLGGVFIYVRVHYAERLHILSSSWTKATKRTAAAEGADGFHSEDPAAANISGDIEVPQPAEAEHRMPWARNVSGASACSTIEAAQRVPWARDTSGASSASARSSPPQAPKKMTWVRNFSPASNASTCASSQKDHALQDVTNSQIPTNFNDMFLFNAAVMGFNTQLWMLEVLASMDGIVSNVAKSQNLLEHCSVLVLRLSKYRGSINLREYKTVMLSSLRSLVTDWGSSHEFAWSWLWENVENLIRGMLGKPPMQEKALGAFLSSLDEQAVMHIRREVFAKFFLLQPTGQDYFKQSTTRLHFISDKVFAYTLEIFRAPREMVDDLSALGLRHVGYGIPTDLFPAFVDACAQVVREMAEDAAADAFAWSLSLIARILTRVIDEGSTIVMKAINVNSTSQLRKALDCAPRGQRAAWMLTIQVGTQSISPLLWAIEAGSIDAAKGILEDLLTIRADREQYYYGMDDLFHRHPDIIKRLCLDATALLPVLLDGLVWRSRTTEEGKRRVNYYIKHLLVDSEGFFAPALEWITETKDPALICHPILNIVMDRVWGEVAIPTFLFGKLWFLFTLVIFVLSESVLNHLKPIQHEGEDALVEPIEVRASIFACRIFIYTFSMGQQFLYHTKCAMRDIRYRRFIRIGPLHVPEYLSNVQEFSGFCLLCVLLLMLTMEPILYCLRHQNKGELLVWHCKEADQTREFYAVLSAIATLLYAMLLSDLAVFSAKMSAFRLICGRLLSELGLFASATIFLTLTFACAASALEQANPDFAGIAKSGVQFMRITLGMFSTHFDLLSEYPVLMVVGVIYVIISMIFMLNVLTAQIVCAYSLAYQDMLGYARLNRCMILVSTMEAVPQQRFQNFVRSLRLEEPLEFGEGDVGVPGGIQVREPACLNATTRDAILRFGGTTATSEPWPYHADANRVLTDAEHFEKLEKLMEKATKRSRRRSNGSSSNNGASLFSTGGTSSSTGASMIGTSSRSSQK
mmetsp:Transcript_105817/g.306087  ORF Transcript_105817/g.306087 Transcript_105817/m.306087 type:complete len:1164 (-) Transcript_105817:65-3556(-)|eukprot:CAMPEP_0176081630 /NCGR_PEP_ID=MMETSP0120_2-20121206/40832_1 /TAXON_ID=160619 /ORGANISM="Kryptoperidinium foliaceum, Strain CCMP 1326" /LENGTH=1163 /DNA_ID=CAMNT_0017415397 /DNA_START=47 /DNA_END=3538 /DNA_ORIENTATION=+